MSIGGYMDMRNQINRARWMWRWAQQGGSMHWRARDLQDLRNDEDRKRWRHLQFLVRHTPVAKKKVVNLAEVRIRNATKRRRNPSAA